MNNDKEMLSAITAAADMGRDSLNHVIDKATDLRLKAELTKQRNQYDSVYSKASEMLGESGESPKKIGAPVKLYSHMVSNMKILAAGDENSKIAEMVIQGSTMGITEMTKQLHGYTGANNELISLAKSQIQMEQSNIEEMKKYL